MSVAPKRLYRSRDDRMLAGVCAGLGEFFNIDPTIVRILFVMTALIFAGFPVLIIYLLLAIIIPLEP